ncbi:radical SAM/SPASM domain-containing protein [Magnetospirillum fulvum]|uniref:Radical SAM additional 4Fe4S-binding SPASM domain-containing protein n=1 Tax=Magnetospirillum fulvum TaxID=1082 RepID=A0A1H6H7Y7_MAGFU|nr:radical SAM protein [Magnetospirillum fulvum]SEH30198.1 radical SAM additional 4Fe4S-binding SPASM domain-containing protein [Magnetospirillum fulvum]
MTANAVAAGTFGDYLSSEFPSQINVDVTEFCNLACTHCPYETVTKIKGANRRHLNVEWHDRMIDEVATVGKGHCRFLRYTGDGEPLLHPKLPEMVAYAVKRTGLPVNVTTNGLLMVENRARALLDAGVTVIDISLDAHDPDTYAKIRVKGDLAVAQANIRELIRLKREGGYNVRVMVSFVRQPLNDREAEPFKAFWEAEGADDVVLRIQHSCAGSVPDMTAQMWAQAPKERRPCLYPWERLVLKPDGQFSFCPADWLHEANIGSIENSTVQQVWQGQKLEALRQAHRASDYANHPFCGKCPDWSVIRWPGEGQNYMAIMERASAS